MQIVSLTIRQHRSLNAPIVFMQAAAEQFWVKYTVESAGQVRP